MTKLIGSAPTIEILKEGIKKFFYSNDIQLIPKDNFFSVVVNGKEIKNFIVTLKRGRYRFELIQEEIQEKKTYLLNAFSLQMLDEFPAKIEIEEVTSLPNKESLISAIGHADTANVLGVQCNRINVILKPGDIAFVAQLQGGRLPEGSTTLPVGFSFKFFKIKILKQ